eukprot:CAMPEP_0119568580 /NCGR_PEP_ID=MMETSP1352-20130426/39305_1 /TAXON_ID=265584 /ORGANISM="Stauroneis constricta, Strain CCMP1120" /LENGTH=107 /DNA_ID=CAMNT_0007618009 /DNA_START=389 /DNA_END=708 /DNA_ORIENTATION=-
MSIASSDISPWLRNGATALLSLEVVASPDAFLTSSSSSSSASSITPSSFCPNSSSDGFCVAAAPCDDDVVNADADAYPNAVVGDGDNDDGVTKADAGDTMPKMVSAT